MVDLVDKAMGSSVTIDRRTLVNILGTTPIFSDPNYLDIMSFEMAASYATLIEYLKLKNVSLYMMEGTRDLVLGNNVLYDLVQNGREKKRIKWVDRAILRNASAKMMSNNTFGLSRFLVTAVMIANMRQVLLFMKDPNEESVSYALCACGLVYFQGVNKAAYKWEDISSYTVLEMPTSENDVSIQLILRLKDGINYPENTELLITHPVFSYIMYHVLLVLKKREIPYTDSMDIPTTVLER
jgi:hypothetical protein